MAKALFSIITGEGDDLAESIDLDTVREYVHVNMVSFVKSYDQFGEE